MMKHRKNKSAIGSGLRLIVIMPLFILAMSLLVLEQLFNMFAGRIYHIMLKWLNKHYYYYAWLERDLADCESILELGCGPPSGFVQTISPLLQIDYGKKTDALDIWQPYVDAHIKVGNYNKCFQADILEIDLPTKAYDAVVMFDVMEHLPRGKVEAINLFGKMENCARKKVIIFAPNGFVENDFVDGDPHQAHVSAWEPGDYKARGYKVLGGTGLRYLFGKASLPRQPQLLFYILGMLSQPLIYHFPKLAWHSYAVKEL